MKKLVRQMGCLVCLLLCGLFCTRAAAMEETVDTEATGTLTVSYTYGTDTDSENNLALAGVCFRIYRIASISANGTYSLTEEFADSGLTDDELNSMEHAQDVNAVVDTLAAWIKEKESETEEDNGDSENEAVTDESGTAVFTNLQTGLYLLIGDSLTTETIVYTNSPSMISIPSVNSEGTGWEYEITANTKAEASSVSTNPEPDTDEPAEEPTEEATESSTGTTTEPSTETAAESQTAASTEPQTETTTVSETEAQTEASTEAATEASTKTTLNATTGAYIEPGTESSASSVTEYSTEVVYSTEIVTDTDSESGNESETADADAVQTGDDTPVMAWLLLLCGSCGIFVTCLYLLRRKMKQS